MKRRWLRRVLTVLITAAAVAPATAYAFDDVPAGSTHAAGIAYVDSKGITHGCDATNYCPDAPVNRAQMATFLFRSSGNDPNTAPSVNADKVDGLDSTQLLSGLELVEVNETITAHTAGATATCPAGKKVVGGGGSANFDWWVNASAPIEDLSGWNVIMQHDTNDDVQVTLDVYAICAATA